MNENKKRKNLNPIRKTFSRLSSNSSLQTAKPQKNFKSNWSRVTVFEMPATRTTQKQKRKKFKKYIIVQKKKYSSFKLKLILCEVDWTKEKEEYDSLPVTESATEPKATVYALTHPHTFPHIDRISLQIPLFEAKNPDNWNYSN